MLCELIATLCAGLFAGAAVYASLVEHPARLECGTVVALTEFRPSYRRGAFVQASLAAAGFVAAVAARFGGGGLRVLVGGGLLGLAIPFTLIVILPTNKRLLDPALTPDSLEAADRWADGVGCMRFGPRWARWRSGSWSGIW